VTTGNVELLVRHVDTSHAPRLAHK
jgi:hypothetical protein